MGRDTFLIPVWVHEVVSRDSENIRKSIGKTAVQDCISVVWRIGCISDVMYLFPFLIFRTIYLDTPNVFNSLTYGYDTRYTIYKKE